MRSKLFTLGGIAVMGALAITPAAGAATKPKTATKASVDALAKKVDTLNTAFGPVKDNVDFLSAAAPQLVAGLTTLGQALQSPEYGVAQVTTTTGGVSLTSPISFSSDIPDDGNGATVSGDAILLPAGTAATGGALKPSITVNVSALIRSAELDVDGTGGPVGQAGGYLYVEAAANTGGYGTTNNGSPFVQCQNVGAPFVSTPTGAAIETPSGTSTSQTLVNLPTGVGRTDQTVPANGGPAVKDLTPGCTFNAVGGVPYLIHFGVTFTDIPRSTSPGPRD